jgi:hypothetical protein
MSNKFLELLETKVGQYVHLNLSSGEHMQAILESVDEDLIVASNGRDNLRMYVMTKEVIGFAIAADDETGED